MAENEFPNWARNQDMGNVRHDGLTDLTPALIGKRTASGGGNQTCRMPAQNVRTEPQSKGRPEAAQNQARRARSRTSSMLRVESLTPAEQDLLMSTAGCDYPPLRTADIRGRVGKSDGNVNVLMGRLA